MSRITDVAYKRNNADEYRNRQLAYRELFQGKTSEVVLRDLIQFCKYKDNTISDSGILNAHHMGLLSVIAHIERMLESELVSDN